MGSLVRYVYEQFYWKWHRNVPTFLACPLSMVNNHLKMLYNNKYYVRLPSFDGSRQLTHPDVVSWRGYLWLTATPYPYSKESYEDPCVYRSSNESRWQPCRWAYPLQKSKFGEFGRVHFSDPVLLPTDDCLMLYYRKRVRCGSVDTDSLFISCCRDGVHWSTPQMISESVQNNYISAAVLTCSNGFMMFHIDLYEHQQTGALILRHSRDGMIWENAMECSICGLMPDTGLWHIAVCGTDSSRDAGDGELTGLFVVKHINGNYEGIYHAISPDSGSTWYIGGKLMLPPEIVKDMKKPYKASFIPGSDDIMIALEDMLGRWYIYRVPCNFCENGES